KGSQWNLYEYTASNPLLYVDPEGTWWAVGIAACCGVCAGWVAKTAVDCGRGPCAAAPNQVSCITDCVVQEFQNMNGWGQAVIGGSCAVCTAGAVHSAGAAFCARFPRECMT